MSGIEIVTSLSGLLISGKLGTLSAISPQPENGFEIVGTMATVWNRVAA